MGAASEKVSELTPAVKLYNEGEYETAIPILWRIFQADRDNQDARSYLLRSLLQPGNRPAPERPLPEGRRESSTRCSRSTRRTRRPRATEVRRALPEGRPRPDGPHLRAITSRRGRDRLANLAPANTADRSRRLPAPTARAASVAARWPSPPTAAPPPPLRPRRGVRCRTARSAAAARTPPPSLLLVGRSRSSRRALARGPTPAARGPRVGVRLRALPLVLRDRRPARRSSGGPSGWRSPASPRGTLGPDAGLTAPQAARRWARNARDGGAGGLPLLWTARRPRGADAGRPALGPDADALTLSGPPAARRGRADRHDRRGLRRQLREDPRVRAARGEARARTSFSFRSSPSPAIRRGTSSSAASFLAEARARRPPGSPASPARARLALRRSAPRTAARTRPPGLQRGRRRARRPARRRSTTSACCRPTTSSTRAATSSRANRAARRCGSPGRRVGVTICEDIWNDKTFWKRPLYPTDPVAELKPLRARPARQHLRLPVHAREGPAAAADDGADRPAHAASRSSAATWSAATTASSSTALRRPSTRRGRLVGARRALSRRTSGRSTCRADAARSARTTPTIARPAQGARPRARGLRRASAASRAPCSGSPAASTRPSRRRSPPRRSGPNGCTGVAMPGPYSSEGSLRDAARPRAAARHPLPGDPDRAGLRGVPPRCSRPSFGSGDCAPAEENLQARIRGRDPDGALEPVRTPRPLHRQQVGDRRRLLHALRRHGRRLRAHLRRPEDAGLRAGAGAQPRPREDPAPPRSRRSRRRSCARTRRTATRCRPTRDARSADRGARRPLAAGPSRPRGARSVPLAARPGDRAADGPQRVQAPPDAAGPEGHGAGLRRGPPLSDRPEVPLSERRRRGGRPHGHAEKYVWKEIPGSSHDLLRRRIRAHACRACGCSTSAPRAGTSAGRSGTAARYLAGVEPDPPLPRFRPRGLRRLARPATRCTPATGTQPFDVVVCADVLEHLAQPEELLARIRDWLQPGGILLASHPERRERLGARRASSSGSSATPTAGSSTAPTCASTRALERRQLLEEAGFRVRAVEATAMPYELAVPCSRGAPWRGPTRAFAQATARAWPTLFGYQFVFEAVRR